MEDKEMDVRQSSENDDKGRSSAKERSGIYGRFLSAPIHLLAILTFSIFFTEAFVMFAISYLPPMSTRKEALLNAFVLINIVSPVIYFFVLKPYIKERTRAEMKLKDNEAKYRSLVESTDDSIYLVDRDYKYIFINKHHISRMGLLNGQYQGKHYSEFHSLDETKEFIENIDAVFKTGKSVKHEHMSHRDGRYFLRTLSPVRDDGGATVAVTVVSKDITDRKEMEEQLEALSLTDDLTGLRNRRGFLTLAEHELKVADRMKRGIFMLYADLDNLKGINDTFGHLEGDRALIETAGFLSNNYRNSDIVARIGGDEFVVIPVGVSDDNIEAITERFRDSLDKFNAIIDRKYDLSISIGIAYYDPKSTSDINDLLTRADRLMYEEKKKKRKV